MLLTELEYTPEEVSEMTGVHKSTIIRQANKGEIIAYKRKKGSRTVLKIPDHQVRILLGQIADDKQQYEPLKEKWLRQQASGYLTGKVIGDRGREANEYGIRKFWDYLKKEPCVQEMNPENLRLALSCVSIDYANKNCHYSQRDQMFKAFCSFYKLLIQEGYRQRSEMETIRQYKPQRIFPPRKTVVQEDSLQALLNTNDTWDKSRTEFDQQLTRTIIILLAYAGLRRQEAINLCVSHLDLAGGYLRVIDGKGHKFRVVGLAPELAEQLHTWLRVRQKIQTASPYLLVTEEGEQTTRDILGKRISRLVNETNTKRREAAEKAGRTPPPDIDVTPHGLRRTFATLMENRGMPWSLMQLALGHKHIKTTQEYVMSDEKTMIDWLRTGGKAPAAKVGGNPESVKSKILDYLGG